MDIYYSQHGEDFLVNKIFGNKKNGYYVEIGCLDGIEFSNTYYFEKNGWKGTCIEAHNDFIVPLRKNRPNASVVHCAVGEADKKSVTFYANKIGSLSTVDKSEEERWKTNYKQYFSGFEEQKVPMRTLTSIFDELKLGFIDFVSLDIEGYEVNALKGLDFIKYRPAIFVIEYKDEIHKQQLEEILFKYNYHYILKLGCNLFYSLNASDKQIVNADYGVVKLHKVDQTGILSSSEVQLSKPTLKGKIRGVLKKSFPGKIWRYYKRVKKELINRLNFPTYEKKREIIDNYRKKNNAKILIETGTYLGDTVEYFRNKVEQVYSIELSEDLFADATKRFQNASNVHIIHGNSGEVLKFLVKKINQPAIYWLDGHYSSEFYLGDKYIRTARGDKITPVIEELETLLHDIHAHVILIDDARLFSEKFGYPALETIFEMVKKSKFSYEAIVVKDIICIMPKK